MSQHPDILDIDALRCGEGRPAHAQHVGNCAECRQIFEDMTALSAAMKEAAGPVPTVPPDLDQRILWQARKQALAVRRSPYEIWRRNRWIAAAAVVLVTAVSVVGLELRGPRLEVARRAVPERQRVAANARREQSPPLLRTAPADFDRDGRVDILDAFVLARAVGGDRKDAHATGGAASDAPGRNGVALGSAGDVNGDGKIDRRDVAAVALRAVSLGDA